MRSWILVVSFSAFGLAGCGCGGDAECGNDVAEEGEECDGTDGCTSDCKIRVCGNSRIEEGEGCDDGNLLPGDACDAFCQEEPPSECGNGIVEQPDEECDAGDANSDTEPNLCRRNCTRPACGDSVIDAGEECDDGAENSDDLPSRCRTSCVVPFCGDSIRDFTEGCDDGGGEAGDGCDSQCFREDVCGDESYVNLMLEGIAVGNTIWYYGDTSGATNRFTPPTECPGAGDAPDQVHLYIAPGGGRVRITTRDATPAGDTQFDTIVYVLTDCDQGVADVVACNDQYILPEPIIDPWGPDTYDDDRAELELSADPGQIFYVVVDGYDAPQAGGYALTITQRPVRSEGEDCDLSGALDLCADGFVCSALEPGHGTCAAATAPVVTDAAFSTIGPWSLVVDVTGTDENGDSSLVLLTFADILGDPVDVNGDGVGDETDVLRLNPDPSFIGSPEFSGVAAMGRYNRAVTANVMVEDLAGEQSAPFPIDIPDFPSPRGEGEECDPSGLDSYCAFSLACVSDGAGGFECGAASCDGYVDMLDHRDGSDWVYEGTTFGATNFDHCNEMGQLSGDIGFTFRPAVSKSYRIAVEDASFSHVLSMRGNCEDPGHWFCNEGNRSQDTVVHWWLDAGVTYYIVVDGNLRAADEGGFTLRIGDPNDLAAGEVCGPEPVDGFCTIGTNCVDLPDVEDNFCMDALGEGEACDPDSTSEYCAYPNTCAEDGGGYTCQNLAYLGDECGGGWGGTCLAGMSCLAGMWSNTCQLNSCTAIDMNDDGVLDAGANTVTYTGTTVGASDFYNNCGFPSGGDVLLSYRTRQDAWVSFDTSGSAVDTSLSVSDWSCTAWDRGANCNDDFGGVRSFVEVGWYRAGTTFYLIVDDKYRIEDDFTLQAREIPMADPWG